MKISERGLELIKKFEGLRLEAYQDAGGIWTIGYGHTGPDVKPGMKITKEEAEQLLLKDLDRFEAAVREEVKVPITQEMFDSLVSFCYNIGIYAFRGSTLLRLLNKGQYEEAAREFQRWVYVRKAKLPGLVRRRKAEENLFREGMNKIAEGAQKGQKERSSANGRHRA